MLSSEKYSLKMIIDLLSLQDIQDKFGKMVGFSTVTVDENGVPIVNPSNFTKFCTTIRNSKKGLQRCIECDRDGGIKAMKAGKPVVYNCHSGLTDVAAPIIVNDMYLGCMLCGQVMIKDSDQIQKIDTLKLSKQLDISEQRLSDALSDVPFVEYEKVKDASEFLFLFSNLIAKMGIINITKSELVEEIREKMKLSTLLKNMELKALQSQVNPHFLFNTLNTIARMALIENSPNTEELIYALSDILRYSLKNADKMVELETEIENIQKYLYIQKVRYGDRINYEFKIEPKILNCKIPVMTLQPLIENSIIHGLKNIDRGGLIKVSGDIIDDDNIFIEIYDNGTGIEQNMIQDMLQVSNLHSSHTGLGIQNVNTRIKHLFGNQYGLEITSSEEMGTNVLIKLPYTI